MYCIIPDNVNFLQRATVARFFSNPELEVTYSNNNKALIYARFQLKSENNESDFTSTPNWIWVRVLDISAVLALIDLLVKSYKYQIYLLAWQPIQAVNKAESEAQIYWPWPLI